VIRAFVGLIVRRDREPGDIVVPGTSIFLLISTKELWVSGGSMRRRWAGSHPVRVPVSSFVPTGHPYAGK